MPYYTYSCLINQHQLLPLFATLHFDLNGVKKRLNGAIV